MRPAHFNSDGKRERRTRSRVNQKIRLPSFYFRLLQASYGSPCKSREILSGMAPMRRLRRRRREAPELGADARDHGVPIAERRLPEQTRRRVPGAGLAIERPAPIGRERQ